MAESEVMLASAVVIPDVAEPIQETTSPVSSTLKRRQTDASEPDSHSKRTRLSPEAQGSKTEPSNNVGEAERRRAVRRESGKAEERNRGKRMFGALLGALSQSDSSAAQKRRADIEKRQQAKLKLISDEASLRERVQMEQLKIKRKREQWKFDEESLRIRHSNMLATAQFLATKAEPRLYYKPWELRPDDDDQIARQIADADDQVEREMDDFQQRRREAIGVDPSVDQQVIVHGGDIVEESAPSKSIVGSQFSKEAASPHAANAGGANLGEPEILTNEDVDIGVEQELPKEISIAQERMQDVLDDEHQGEMVVEAEEDTVIY